MTYELPAQRRALIEELIARGATNREITAVVKCSLATVRKVRHEIGHAELQARGETLEQLVDAEIKDDKRRI